MGAAIISHIVTSSLALDGTTINPSKDIHSFAILREFSSSCLQSIGYLLGKARRQNLYGESPPTSV